MYHHLAHLYDWQGSEDFTETMLGETQRILRQQNLVPSILLDLACGTGTFSIHMAQQGWDVIGLDSSEPMLTIAQKKAKQANCSVMWLQAKMQSFKLSDTVSVVTCFYDSLNHLPGLSELQQTVACVEQVLKPQGLFIFDLNTLETYQSLWQGQDTMEGPNYRLLSTACYDEKTQKAQANWIAQEYTNTGFQQTEETVVQHYFDDTTVETLLVQAGFSLLEKSVFNPIEPPPGIEALKTLWVWQK